MALSAAQAGLPPLSILGDFEIQAELGRGGMGVVYRARQLSLNRIVALKVIRPGFASPEFLRRFEREQQVLARLQHPGIAQIYEAGAAETGFGSQPYFAMEFIQGVPLGEYARSHRLDTRQRLELIAKVCDGVDHAHQRGVIHRPSSCLPTCSDCGRRAPPRVPSRPLDMSSPPRS